MDDNLHHRFILPDRSYQGLVRSELRKMAQSAGFTGHRLGEIEIIIAEITSNLVKHAIKGGIILSRVISHPEKGIELIAIDNGPGMRMPTKMMEDGQSTKSTLGQGLGAIRRLSDLFDMYTLRTWGTIVLSRTYIKKGVKNSRYSFELNGIRVAKKEESKCGDAWSIRETDKILKLALIDGLGHGNSANAAAMVAVNTLVTNPANNPVDELRNLHDTLKKTRGAVVNVAHFDKKNKQLYYSGVGNISMRIITPNMSKGCFSYNGIVGHILPASLNNHQMQWNEKVDTVVMHSDGLTSRWDLQKYPGLLNHHGTVISAALYKDHNRGSDDSTVIVGKFAKRLNG